MVPEDDFAKACSRALHFAVFPDDAALDGRYHPSIVAKVESNGGRR
jgi:hypothetical protein